MKLSLNDSMPRDITTDCLVLGFAEGAELTPSAQAIDEVSGGAMTRMLQSGDIETGIGKTHYLHNLPGLTASRILAVGFGKHDKLDLPRFDRACLAAGRGPARSSADPLPRSPARTGIRRQRRGSAPAAGGPCHPPRQLPLHGHQAAQGRRPGSAAIGLFPGRSGAAGGPRRRRRPSPWGSRRRGFWATCHPTSAIRPTSRRKPPRLPRSSTNVELEILEESDMAELGMDALLGVSRGSANRARLIVLKYSGAAADQRPGGAHRQGRHLRFRWSVAEIGRKHDADEIRHVRRRRRHRRVRRLRPDAADHQRGLHRRRGRKHAGRRRLPARRRPDQHVRQDDRSAEHRRRGPPGPV